MDNLSARFMQLKQKKEELERSIMETNVRIEALQKDLKDAMQVLKEKYGVNTLEEAKALFNKKDLEYSAIAKQLEDKLSEYENLLK
jgi:uncharacterized phage infection (PIP) family protein YhgE